MSGILNITTDENHHVRELYVDLGCDSREEVAALGVEIGNMVCFASSAHPFNHEHVYAYHGLWSEGVRYSEHYDR